MSYIMYLRKSQVDRDYEAVSDTLSRHKAILTEFCNRSHLNVTDILEEVVSGESLSTRPQMQKCLELINTGNYDGIICMDIDRLSRGSSFDSGYIMQCLKVNGCKIVTPSKTYDLQTECDEQFTDLKFMFSRYELRTITKRLKQGKERSLREGKWTGSTVPFGYDKVKLPGTKGNTLTPNDDAIYVVKAFEKCASGSSIRDISAYLTSVGHPKKSTSVHQMLHNPVYLGMVTIGKRQTKRSISQDGKLVKKIVISQDYETVPGLHPALIPQSLWDEAQGFLTKKANVPTKKSVSLKNELAGIARCKVCGNVLTYTSTASGRVYLACYNRCVRSSLYPDVLAAIRNVVKTRIDNLNFEITEESESNQIKEELEMCRKSLSVSVEKQQKACEMLEQGIYTPQLFESRNRVLTAEIVAIENHIKELEAEAHKEKLDVPEVVNALDLYDDMTIEERNLLLKKIIKSAIYYRGKQDMDFQVDVTLRI